MNWTAPWEKLTPLDAAQRSDAGVLAVAARSECHIGHRVAKIGDP